MGVILSEPPQTQDHTNHPHELPTVQLHYFLQLPPEGPHGPSLLRESGEVLSFLWLFKPPWVRVRGWAHGRCLLTGTRLCSGIRVCLDCFSIPSPTQILA